MNTHGWLTLVTCSGELALVVLALFRGGKSPLAMPLALLCSCLFGWNFFNRDLLGRADNEIVQP